MCGNTIINPTSHEDFYLYFPISILLLLLLPPLHLPLPSVHKTLHLHVHPQPLGLQGTVHSLQLARCHIADQRREGLHHHGLGEGTGVHGPVEDVLGLGPQLLAPEAEADVGYPQPRAAPARLAGHGVLERRPRRVRDPYRHLVPEGEYAACGRVAGPRQDRRAQEVADRVVQPEGWLGPREEGEEHGICGEQAEKFSELVAEVDGAVRSVLYLLVINSLQKKTKYRTCGRGGGAQECLALPG